jgi:sugar lactone lactonase YvrE
MARRLQHFKAESARGESGMGCSERFDGVELVLDAHALTGEAPTWSRMEQLLYWIDVEEPSLHRFDPKSGCDRKWEAPSELGAIALCDDGDVLLALRTGLVRLSLTAGRCEWLASPPFNPFTHRFNDGACDARGRFWIGVMHDPLQGSACDAANCSAAHSLHVFSDREGMRAGDASATLGNGIVWSPDQRRMYYTDTEAGEIRTFDFDLEEGLLSNSRLFKRFEPADGKPDGAAIDDDGCYWCALYGGGRVVCLDGEGKLVREIRLPVSQPTMCAFGDEDGGSLYITSAAHGLSRREEPFAGGLFRCRPGVRGEAARLFGARAAQ